MVHVSLSLLFSSLTCLPFFSVTAIASDTYIIDFPDVIFSFYRILGAGDSVSFDTSFWNEKIETEKKTEYKYTNNEKGREMVTAAVFLLGELSMVGFSLDEDEGTAATVKKNLNSKLPSFFNLRYLKII
jgi:hypothetical protein